MSGARQENLKHGAGQIQAMLALERKRVSHATGLTREDYKYLRADGVRESDISGWVFVTTGGQEYGPARLSAGSLEPEGDNLTALVNAKPQRDGEPENWTKAWFPQKEIKPAPPKTDAQEGFRQDVLAILSKDYRPKA